MLKQEQLTDICIKIHKRLKDTIKGRILVNIRGDLLKVHINRGGAC